ncbi:hypothetical protein BT96DRAFT_1080978, partial [Gymnopus androsaceus JB14]
EAAEHLDTAPDRPYSTQKHFHCIGKVKLPFCPCCKCDVPETVFHYLMECPAHCALRSRMRWKMAAKNWNVSSLLTAPGTLKYLF